MKTTKTRKDEAVERIAREVLMVETLERRHRDGLDFHDLAVWTLRSALEAAYEAGKRASR
jgi:hypothetical protein